MMSRLPVKNSNLVRAKQACNPTFDTRHQFATAMPRRGNSASAEVLQFRSPAEFFAENQNIAGFDNVGGERVAFLVALCAAL